MVGLDGTGNAVDGGDGEYNRRRRGGGVGEDRLIKEHRNKTKNE